MVRLPMLSWHSVRVWHSVRSCHRNELTWSGCLCCPDIVWECDTVWDPTIETSSHATPQDMLIHTCPSLLTHPWPLKAKFLHARCFPLLKRKCQQGVIYQVFLLNPWMWGKTTHTWMIHNNANNSSDNNEILTRHKPLMYTRAQHPIKVVGKGGVGCHVK